MTSIPVHPYRADLSSRDFQEISRSRVLVVHFESGYDRALDLKLRVKLLSELSGVPPEGLKFGKTEEGKPVLLESPWSFSVSHSSDFWAFAASSSFDVGIDLERFHPVDRLEKVALRHFLPEENDSWRAIPDEAGRVQELLRIWTRKEAFVKAKASNLFREFQRINVLGSTPDCSFESFAETGSFIASLARLKRPE